MVSLQGNHEPNDLKYRYTVQPIRKNITHLNTSPESILGLLQDNSDFSIFYNLVIKAELYGRLNDIQANFTMFVPSNEYLLMTYSPQFFENMDLYTAREIVLFHTLNKKVSYEMLSSSQAMYLHTMIDDSMYSRLMCNWSQASGVRLHRNTFIKVPNIYRKNGLIHVVDNIMIPSTLMN